MFDADDHTRVRARHAGLRGSGLAVDLTERGGSSEYFPGGAVVYSNEAKVSMADVDPGLIEEFGAVSNEVAEALASGAALRFGADFGIVGQALAAVADHVPAISAAFSQTDQQLGQAAGAVR